MSLIENSTRFVLGILPIVFLCNIFLSAQSPVAISGKVIDPTYESVPGAKVFLENADGELVGSTITDNEGRFSFSSISEGTYSITVQIPEFITTKLVNLDYRGPDSKLTGLEILLNIDFPNLAYPPLVISGVPLPELIIKVVEADTKMPLAGVELLIPDNHGSPIRSSTDADGKAWVQLPAGVHRIQLSKSGYGSETRTITVREERQIIRVEMIPSQ